MEQEINFCPRCGSGVRLQEKFGKLRAVCPNCGWIHFADPKVAAAVLLKQAGRVLLVRRVNEPFRGLWTLPAGFIDAGEDPAQAAERECLEETSLTVHATRVVDVIAGREHPRARISSSYIPHKSYRAFPKLAMTPTRSDGSSNPTCHRWRSMPHKSCWIAFRN